MFDKSSLFFWCPCMAINVSVQYNGGLLPDIMLLTQCYCAANPDVVLSFSGVNVCCV